MTRLLPIVFVGLTSLVTTMLIETIYLVCHLWQWVFDGSALSFNWIEPLPVAGPSTVAVLLTGLLASRLMSLSNQDSTDAITVKQAADYKDWQTNLSRHLAGA
jgi:hypothetical protein